MSKISGFSAAEDLNADEGNKFEGLLGTNNESDSSVLRSLDHKHHEDFYFEDGLNIVSDKTKQGHDTFEAEISETQVDPEHWLKVNTEIVGNALLASTAVYEKDPWSYLSSNDLRSQHSLKNLDRHKTEDCHFLIAEDNDYNVYLAFRGSVTMQDWKTNFNIQFEKINFEVTSAGNVHSGFLQKTKTIPLLTILSSKDLKGKQFIICGHSQGGAVAAIVYTLLKEAKSSSESTFLEGIRGLKNITFAAPLFGDDELKKIMEDDKLRFDSDMFHYVAQNDPVPGSLLLSSTITAARDSWSGIVIRPAIQLLRLASKPLDDFMKTNTGCLNPSRTKLYQPVGNYILLGSDESREFVSCKDGTKKVCLLNKIKPNPVNHKMNHYKRLLSPTLLKPQMVKGTTIFKPKIYNVNINTCGQSSVVGEYKIEITGDNMSSDSVRECYIIIGSEAQQRTVKIFDHKQKNCFKISDHSTGILIEAKTEQSLNHKTNKKVLKIETVFGETEFDLAESKVEMSVSTCLQIAFERCEALKEKTAFKELISEVSEILNLIESKKRRLNCGQHNAGQIVQAFKEPLTLEANNPSKKFLEGATRSAGLLNVSWNPCHSEAAILTVGRDSSTEIGLNGNYSTVLRYLAFTLEQVNKTEKSPGNQGLSTEYQTDLQLEGIISEMFEEYTGDELLKRINQKVKLVQEWFCLTRISKILLTFAVARIIKIHSIRKLLKNDLFIGIAGAQNAGKTNFLNKLCNQSKTVGDLTHTTELEVYSIPESNVYVLDFPGSDAIDDSYSKCFSKYGAMCDFFVVIVRNEGDLSKNACRVIKCVAEKYLHSKSSTNLVICFNQSQVRFPKLKQELNKLSRTFEDHKTSFVTSINELIKYTQLQIEANNIFFTDWDSVRDGGGAESNLFGVDKIRDEIIARLNLNDVDFHTSIAL